MRPFIFILAFLSFNIGINAQADAISQFFSAYEDDEAFSSVYISPKMFQMFAGADSDETENNEELQRILNSIKGLRILSTDTNGIELFKQSKKKLTNNSYEVLMVVKEDDNDVEFLIKDGKDGKIEELLLLVGGTKGFTMLSFIGNVSLSDLAQLASQMEIDGLEYLDQLEDK